MLQDDADVYGEVREDEEDDDENAGEEADLNVTLSAGNVCENIDFAHFSVIMKL